MMSNRMPQGKKRWVRDELSPRDRDVMDVLGATLRPLSAYDLVEALWTRGVRAATTVYRSLHRLTGLGLVHRLESVNAYVVCSHDGDHAGVVFAICESCGNVTEFADANIIERLGARAQAEQFSMEHATLELKGRCHACAGKH